MALDSTVKEFVNMDLMMLALTASLLAASYGFVVLCEHV
jgi:hypothetical protein